MSALFILMASGNHINQLTNSLNFHSASPLNGQAAQLWDSDPVEFRRLALARHQDLDED